MNNEYDIVVVAALANCPCVPLYYSRSHVITTKKPRNYTEAYNYQPSLEEVDKCSKVQKKVYTKIHYKIFDRCAATSKPDHLQGWEWVMRVIHQIDLLEEHGFYHNNLHPDFITWDIKDNGEIIFIFDNWRYATKGKPSPDPLFSRAETEAELHKIYDC